jgi:hypothetical protein
MDSGSSLVELTTVVGSFHAKVISARLESEGIRCELIGDSDGPYPIPTEIRVLVREDALGLAREILLADAVDAVFDPTSRGPRQPRRTRWRRLRRQEGR